MSERNYGARYPLTNLNEALQVASDIPYNTVAPFYRHYGVDFDPQVYGTDCVGMLNILGSLLPKRTLRVVESQYAKGPLAPHAVRHFAGIFANRYYVDPFLTHGEAVDLAALEPGQEVLVNTLTDYHHLKVVRPDPQNPDLLHVSKIRTTQTGLHRQLLSYSFDLGVQQDVAAIDSSLHASLPFLVQDPDGVGGEFRASYKVRSKNFDVCNLSRVDLTLEEERERYDQHLRTRRGITIDDMREFFEAGKDLVRYFRHWEEIREV
jgi:hypothetical protein